MNKEQWIRITTKNISPPVANMGSWKNVRGMGNRNYLSYFWKGDHIECSNYRGIILLNITYKIFICLIYNRLAKYSEPTLGKYQAEFRPNRSNTCSQTNFGKVLWVWHSYTTYRVIHKSVKHFKNSQQINYSTDHGTSYADRETHVFFYIRGLEF